MRIALGSDHAGLDLKWAVVPLLQELGHQPVDFGTTNPDPVDYPDVAVEVARAVVAGQFKLGILICGTGLGMSIAANKVPGIRAALCHDIYSAHVSREHNDANILCLGGRVIGMGPAWDVVKAFLAADFSPDERHHRRVAKVNELDARSRPGGESGPSEA